MSAPNGKQNDGPARKRYWTRHDLPMRKITTRPGMQQRIRLSEYTLIQVIADLATRSDKIVTTVKRADLLRNRAFVEHEQKLRGRIHRLGAVTRGSAFKHDEIAAAKDGVYTMASGRIAVIPHRAEVARLRSAFKTLDIHYEPCGKRSETNRCRLSNQHIGECKEEV